MNKNNMQTSASLITDLKSMAQLMRAHAVADSGFNKSKKYEVLIYTTHPQEVMKTNENYNACKSMLAFINIPFHEIHDLKKTLILCQGKVNPNNGFVILTPGLESIILNCIELGQWINEKGMVPC